MKIIITENIIFKVAKKELTKKFGDLTPFAYDEEDNIVYYINKERALYFEYDKEENYCRIGDTIWDFLTDTFGLDDYQIQEVIKEWLEDHYKIKDVLVTTSAW
jgi:hypothetical protein